MKIIRYLPILIFEKGHIFSPYDWNIRPPFSNFTQNYIDKIFYIDKLKARGISQNKFITENKIYTDNQISKSRLLCKNLDGLIFLSEEFNKIYPDAKFLALIRNGYAVIEGQVRRGRKLEDCAYNYNNAVRKILDDSKNIPNYFIIKFEDIINRPYKMLKEIYNYAELDLKDVKKIRLETKKYINSKGKRRNIRGFKKKELVWYEPNSFSRHFIKEVNKNQIDRLTDNQVKIINKLCKESLDYFNYTIN